MDRACEEDGDDGVVACGCVCLLGWEVAESEGGCCRKAASREDRKNGRCEGISEKFSFSARPS